MFSKNVHAYMFCTMGIALLTVAVLAYSIPGLCLEVDLLTVAAVLTVVCIASGWSPPLLKSLLKSVSATDTHHCGAKPNLKDPLGHFRILLAKRNLKTTIGAAFPIMTTAHRPTFDPVSADSIKQPHLRWIR